MLLLHYTNFLLNYILVYSYAAYKAAYDSFLETAGSSTATKDDILAARKAVMDAYDALKLNPGYDPNQMGQDGTPLGKGASAVAADKAITGMTSDKDPAGSVFAPLMARSVKQTKTSVTLTWTKAKGATKYVIYGNACGKKNKMTKLATVTGKSKKFTKIAGKKVKKGTYYKFIVVAIDKNNCVVGTSKVVHAASKGGKSGNLKSVTVKAKVNSKGKKLKSYKTLKSTVIKKGKTVKVKTTVKPASKKVKVKKHRVVSYESSNKKIATVTSKGKIKGVKKGTCYIYVYGQNGVYKKIKIKVK